MMQYKISRMMAMGVVNRAILSFISTVVPLRYPARYFNTSNRSCPCGSSTLAIRSGQDGRAAGDSEVGTVITEVGKHWHKRLAEADGRSVA
jgi:hypothetical protein